MFSELMYLVFFCITSLLGLGVVIYSYKIICSIPVTNDKAQHIAELIRHGAMTFLKREYSILVVVVAVASGLIYMAAGTFCAAAYATGSVASMLAGFIGMSAATKANVRTAIAAKDEGEHKAFEIALLGGSIMGFIVASLGLSLLGIIFYLAFHLPNLDTIITCFAIGASSIALFARVGGGIFTKAADIGADLVGKVEVGIPEDDPRNPAVIADNVGDCVGDTAGMGADIFESYVGSIGSGIILALQDHPGSLSYAAMPLMLSAIGLICSVFGLGSILGSKKGNLGSLLHSATNISVLAFIVLSAGYVFLFGIAYNLIGSIVLGGLAGVVIGFVTDYYTNGQPVIDVAKSSLSGAATNIIHGIAVGYESLIVPMWAIAFIVFVSFKWCGGLFGVAISAISMLSTVAITMTVDAYGPIADNAGGISEMSGFGPETRAITDRLDSLGNMTAALGKGFAIGSAALASLSIFGAFCKTAGLDNLNLIDPYVISGMILGGTMPFFLASATMKSVGRAAWKMVNEVRRQFKENPGIMDGSVQPDYDKCINISTNAALSEMILPGLVTVLAPVFIKYLFNMFDSQGNVALGGFLVGSTIVGVLMALFMANSGGVWDNAKKYIEAGNLGGKGSEAHKAAVTGDTVGDPFKDTSGPSLNILIKLMSVMSLFLAGL